MPYLFTTQNQIRKSFWELHPELDRKRINKTRLNPNGEYVTDTRVAFCDYIEHLARSGAISDALANRATL